jgi:MoxR-like ATPase
MSDETPGADAQLKQLADAYSQICEQVGHTIVGQQQIIEQLMTCILARGHCILEGAPGLAKTLLVNTLSQCLSLDFARVQFTPDLMPSDITGTEVLQENQSTGERFLKYIHGPIFSNVVLADEINRAPPKTQAALLEAMQERQVTAGGHRHKLPAPFFVLSTMNPVEQEGTYPLPEAQLDRFMMKALVGYPTEEEERQIYRMAGAKINVDVTASLSADDIIALQDIVARIPVSELSLDYAMRLVRSTRQDDPQAPEYIKRWVNWGAGPRAGQSLILAAKSRAALYGEPEVTIDQIKAVAVAVLRHRLVLNYTAEADGQSPDDIINRLLDEIPVQAAQGAMDDRVDKILTA